VSTSVCAARRMLRNIISYAPYTRSWPRGAHSKVLCESFLTACSDLRLLKGRKSCNVLTKMLRRKATPCSAPSRRLGTDQLNCSSWRGCIGLSKTPSNALSGGGSRLPCRVVATSMCAPARPSFSIHAHVLNAAPNGANNTASDA
jgi:hypothetical protein